jgi:hypothetical protein
MSIYKTALTRSFDDPSHVEHVIVIRGDPDALGRAFLEFVDLAHESTHNIWRNRLEQVANVSMQWQLGRICTDHGETEMGLTRRRSTSRDVDGL